MISLGALFDWYLSELGLLGVILYPGMQDGKARRAAWAFGGGGD